MSGMIQDLITGKMTPKVANATCNAGAKLLKVVEMQHIYGSAGKAEGSKVLQLLETPNGKPMTRARALSKLSDEERQCLGLSDIAI